MSAKGKKPLVPRLRFAEFREAGEWVEDTLENRGCFTGGGTPNKGNQAFWKGNFPWVSSSDISEDTIHHIEITKFITKGAINKSATKVVPRNSLLIVERVAVGKIAVTIDEISTSQDFINFTPQIDDVIFLGYYLKSKKNVLLGFSQGMAIKGFTKNDIATLILSFPASRQKQQKIATCLTALDDLISAATGRLDALKQHKQGLMQQLFPAEGETVPRLRFPEFRDDDTWQIKLLGKVAKNCDSKRMPITEEDRIKGDVPYYGASGIIDYVHDYIFDEDLLCISEDGANLVTRIYPIAFSISGRSWINNHAHVLKFKKSYTQVIVQNYLNLVSLKDYLTGMAQPKLNRAMLDIIPIPIPESKEQQKIAACLTALDDLISAQTQKIAKLKTHKRGLMQQLFPAVDETHR